MFAQDGLTVSAWGDGAYTASPGVHPKLSLGCKRRSALGSRRLIRRWQRREFQAPSPARAYAHIRISMLAARGYTTPEITGKLPGFCPHLPVYTASPVRAFENELGVQAYLQMAARRTSSTVARQSSSTGALACWRRWVASRLKSLASFLASGPHLPGYTASPICRWQRGALQAPSPDRAYAQALQPFGGKGGYITPAITGKLSGFLFPSATLHGLPMRAFENKLGVQTYLQMAARRISAPSPDRAQARAL